MQDLPSIQCLYDTSLSISVSPGLSVTLFNPKVRTLSPSLLIMVMEPSQRQLEAAERLCRRRRRSRPRGFLVTGRDTAVTLVTQS